MQILLFYFVRQRFTFCNRWICKFKMAGIFWKISLPHLFSADHSIRPQLSIITKHIIWLYNLKNSNTPFFCHIPKTCVPLWISHQLYSCLISILFVIWYLVVWFLSDIASIAHIVGLILWHSRVTMYISPLRFFTPQNKSCSYF